MAPPATGTKFASVNLNKSYGQPASIGAGVAASGLQGSGRSRLPTQGGMLLLTRPVRSQPSGAKGVKLTVPRPMNLPSLRREHSGNDPAIALVGGSGVSGWSKHQQQSADNVGGKSGSVTHSAHTDSPSGPGRSTALSTESTWGASLDSNQNGELRSSSYTPPVDRPTVYTPPGARTVQADSISTQLQPHPALVTKAVVLRGEDFPTLQASLPPSSANPQQRQKELQQRQREKRQELKEQQVKLHELSRQRTENSPPLQQIGPQLQPAQSMRPQTKPNLANNSALYDKQSVSHQDVPVVQPSGIYRKANGFPTPPPPLVRLNHTSNWTDDERETLHSLRPQSYWPGRDRAYSESHNLDVRALDQSDEFGYGRPSFSRNTSLSGYARDEEANQDQHFEKDSGFKPDGWNGRGNSLNNYSSKEAYSGRADLNSREGRESSFGWEGSYKRGWSSGKDSTSKIDSSFGRPTGFTRDGMVTRNNGYTKDINTRGGSLGSGDREAIYGRESPVRDAHRDVPVREGNFRGGHFRDRVANDNVRRGTGSGQDRSHRWQGDRFARSFSHQQEGPVNRGRTSSLVGGRMEDSTGYNFGRDKRQSYTDDSFMKEITELPFLDLRTNSGLGMEHVGLDLKVPRRKKDVTKEDSFWDPERESFEAELERVQKMLEQERQKMVEERERAVELARKEQEERERAVREEEERQRKVEQEAREAALREEREIVEAAQKLEEERRAREEEKRRIAIEEERRKEAARRKLNELEERIAKRETERKREEAHALRRDDERLYTGRPRDENETLIRGETRKRDDGDWEQQEHFTRVDSVPDHDDDERAPFRLSSLSYSSAREVSNERNLQVKHLERSSRSLELKTGTGVLSERPKTTPAWRRESVDNGSGPTSVPPCDSFLPSWQREHPQRGFSPRGSLYGAQRNMPSALSEDKDTSDLLVRKDRALHLQEQRWNSNEDLEFPARYSLSDMDSGYYDGAYDTDVDRNWVRDSQQWVREGHRLASPPLPFYLQSTDVTDPLPFGRSRQSLPRQPRVLPPPSRSSVHKPALKTDINLSLTSTVSDDDSKLQHSGIKSHGGEYFNDSVGNVKPRSERTDGEEQVENAQYRDNLLQGVQSSKQEGTVLQLESAVQPDISSHSSEVDSQESGTLGFQCLPEMHAGSTTSDLLREAVEEDVNTCLAAANEEIFDSEIVQDSPAVSKEASMDDEDMEEDWAMERGEVGLRKEDAEEDVDHGYDGAADQSLENQELESLKNDEDAASEFLAEDYKEVTMEEQNYKKVTMEDQNYQKTCEEEGVDSEPLEAVQELHRVDTVEAEQEIVEAELHSEESVNETQSPQEALQEAVVERFPQRGPFLMSNAIDSIQLREPDVLSSRQSLVQQFQQPFSFMAMPFPQSNTPSTASHHPLGLAPTSGLQNQPDIPFQVQLGLLPGTPLLPNAIQIGSIQMPLHLHHPQMPQLTHLHASQAPVFQFGQIGQSAPLPQPLPMVQPAMQIHHPLCQATPLQSYQAHTMHQIEDSCQVMSTITMQQNAQLSGQVEVPLSQNLSPGLVELKSTLEASNHVEVVSRSVLKPDMQSNPVGEAGVNQQAGLLGSQNNDVSRKPFQDTSADMIVGAPASTGMMVDQFQANDGSIRQSSEISHGGRRRGGGARSGFFGRGPGRFYSGKTYEGPNLVSEPSVWLEAGGAGGGYGRNRGRRNFRRAEFRVKDTTLSVDRNSTHSVTAGMRQPAQERTRSMGAEAFSAYGQTDPATQIHRVSGSDTGQNTDTVVTLRPSQSGRRVDRLNTANALEKNGTVGISSGSRSSEVTVKKYVNAEAPSDTPLQSGVVCVFEQPGIETPKDEDDFIEVRSKRQMLNDRREQREKENKAKSKDLKAKDHALRKQQRLPVKVSQQADLGIPVSCQSTGSQMVERQSPLPNSVEAVGNEIKRSQHGYVSGGSPTISQSSANAPAHLLAPIGTPASCLPDMAIDKRAKSLGPMHANPSMGVVFNDSDIARPLSSVIDSCSNTTMAWGGQRSNQQVVSFTQIQLEEAMKPVYFGGPLPQQLPLPERGSMVLGPGIPVSIAHEKTINAVSGPISSLLAGEKIQFGAVTSPTLISPSSRPLSPPILGSSLGSRADDVSDSKSQARHLSGLDTSDRDAGFISRNKRTKGDDINRHAVDAEAEAEAEAAASAVAAAAISSDESVGSMHHSNVRNVSLVGTPMPITGNSFDNADSTAASSGIPTMRPVVMQTPIIEDSMAVALPADLSIETPPLLFRGPVAQGSSGFVLPPLPGGPSPFSCLEMGTMLGGPIFALGPQDDAPSISLGSNKPVSSLDPGLPAIGPGVVGGWQQRHSGGMMDSFYGGPHSGFTGPFISPTGGIPSMQGPPHMLVYTNPFASVGQYGQVGVSFMGTAYLPSGKQPDWKHTPLPTASSAGSGLNGGERGSNLVGIMTPQRSTGMLNVVQRTAPGGPSVMPAAPPLGLFDSNLSAPFQISNADVQMQSQWSHVISQHPHNGPVSGPIMGLTMQPHHSGGLPSQIGNLPHMMETNGFHPVSVLKLASSAPYQSMDAVGRFPDELGMVDSASSNMSSLTSGGQRPSSRGHVSNSVTAVTPGPSGNKIPRGRRSSRAVHGSTSGGLTGTNSGTAVLETGLGSLDGQSANGNPCSPHFQTQNFGQSGAVGQHAHLVGHADQRGASLQGAGRVNIGNEWSGGHRKGVAFGRPLVSERGQLGDRGFPSSSKLKQVYVAKPSSQKSATNDSFTPESGASILSGQ